ncbi:ATP-binding cassette domain-containing protein [Enterococcus faecalis]
MKITNLSKSYGGNPIFEDVTFSFSKGIIYSIFGVNGVGKTTLLNIINGNLGADIGRVEYNEGSLFIEDNHVPFEFMTADEFIVTTFKFKKSNYSEEQKNELFERLNFQPGKKRISEYSKGMRSKLVLILALLANPPILLLDEPFSDIDLVSFKEISHILKAERNKRIVIFSTHVAKIAYELADKILYLKNDGLFDLTRTFVSSDELEKFVLEKMENQ